MAVKIPFTADSTGFERGLSGMRSSAKSLGKDVQGSMTGGKLGFLKAAGGVGLLAAGVTAVTAGVGKMIRSSSEWGSLLSDQALEARMGVEDFQAALLLAMDAGHKPQTIIMALKKIQSTSVDAANGNKLYQDSFKRLNIDVEEFIKLPTKQKLEAVAKGFKNGAQDTQAYRDLMQIMGEKTGPKMIEILERIGTEGFDNLSAKMKNANKILSEDQIKALDEAEDAWQRFFHTIKVGAASVSSSIIDLMGVRGSDKQKEISDGFSESIGDSLVGSFGGIATETGGKAKKGYLPGQREAEFKKMKEQQKEREKEADKKAKITEAQTADRKSKIDAPAIKKQEAEQKKLINSVKKNIDSIQKQAVGVKVSSLQSIGGGGTVSSIGASQLQLMRSQEMLLKQLVENTSPSKLTGKPTAGATAQ